MLQGSSIKQSPSSLGEFSLTSKPRNSAFSVREQMINNGDQFQNTFLSNQLYITTKKGCRHWDASEVRTHITT